MARNAPDREQQVSEMKNNFRTDEGSDVIDQATAYSQDNQNFMYSIDRVENTSKNQGNVGRG